MSDRNDDSDAYTGETIVMRRERTTKPMPRPGRPAAQPPRRKQRRRLPIGRVLLILLLLALGAVAFAYMQVQGLAADTVVRDVRPGLRIASPAMGMNLLLIGVDERSGQPEEGVRSDTLILVHLNGSERWVSLLSIPRDSIATIRDLGQSKINAAYSYGYGNAEALYGAGTQPREGGMALAAETVEQFTGLPVDAMAQVNFEGFAGIVDALGGITIDVPTRIIDEEYPTPDFGITRIEFEPGVQKMNGERALIYARTRHADSDFGRSARQQQVISAISAELRRRGPLGLLMLSGSLRSALGGTVATTLPFSRPDLLIQLAWLGSGLNADTIARLQLTPETAAVQESGSDLYWDAGQVHALAQRLLVRPSPAAEAARIQVLNGTETQGLAGRISLELEAAGFVLLPAGDAPEITARTQIYDVTGKPATSRRLADRLRGELRQGAPAGVISDADIIVIVGQDYR